MKLAEPVTAITDFLLSFECIVFSILLAAALPVQVSRFTWAGAFAALAAGSLAGGLFHGLRPVLAPSKLLWLWRITAISLVCGFVLFAAGGLYSVLSIVARPFLLVSTGILLLLTGLRLSRKTIPEKSEGNFFPHLAVILLLLGFFLLQRITAGGAAPGTHLLLGSWLCVLGIAVQQRKFRIGSHVNQNDMCHLIFLAGLYFLYMAGMRLHD